MTTAFETKKKIVEAGNSHVFNEWHRLTNGAITMEDFIDALEWLCDDPCNGGRTHDKLTRELCLKLNRDAYNRERVSRLNEFQREVYGSAFPYDEEKVSGCLVRAKRVYGTAPDTPMGFYDEGGHLMTSIIGVSVRDHI
jgi:hypothetical protein